MHPENSIRSKKNKFHIIRKSTLVQQRILVRSWSLTTDLQNILFITNISKFIKLLIWAQSILYSTMMCLLPKKRFLVNWGTGNGGKITL